MDPVGACQESAQPEKQNSARVVGTTRDDLETELRCASRAQGSRRRLAPIGTFVKVT